MPRLVINCNYCCEIKPVSSFNITVNGSCCNTCITTIKKYDIVGDWDECYYCGDDVNNMPRFYKCENEIYVFCVSCDDKFKKSGVNREKYL